MDGTRDRPPGKTAQNWSRKDGIRAGAVTGPWRSAPRAPETLTPENPPPETAGAAAAVKADAGRVAPRPEAGVPAEAPVPKTAAAPKAAAARPAAALALGLREWIALGVLAAVAIVALAVIFRPDQAATTAPAAAEAPAAKAAAAAPVPTAPAPRVLADPALAGVTAVRLRVGPGFPAERQAAILGALEKAGITGVRVEQLPFEIATSRVGYYRAADLAAAEALGRVVAPVIAANGAAGDAVGVRDYGQLLADAEPGRLDLWVGR